MIETPGETPVERRLRILARVSDLPEVDAGREALELLRKWRGPETWDWRMARKALLARCEETPR